VGRAVVTLRARLASKHFEHHIWLCCSRGENSIHSYTVCGDCQSAIHNSLRPTVAGCQHAMGIGVGQEHFRWQINFRARGSHRSRGTDAQVETSQVCRRSAFTPPRLSPYRKPPWRRITAVRRQRPKSDTQNHSPQVQMLLNIHNPSQDHRDPGAWAFLIENDSQPQLTLTEAVLRESLPRLAVFGTYAR
jgi:hypothetical protein